MKKKQKSPARPIRQRYLKIAQHVFDDWASMVDFCRIGAGKNRFHQAESAVGWLAKTGALTWVKYHKRKVYIVPRLAQGTGFAAEANIAHGLGSTDVRVRLILSDRQAAIIPERHFRKQRELGIIPDGGLVYPGGWVLLYELCTADNSARLNVLRWKVNHYLQIVADKPQYQVLFVLDVPRARVVETVTKLTPHEALFYVDYASFQAVPLGQQLTAAIYINGGDGKIYPLRNHEPA